MDSDINRSLERAENELVFAKAIKLLSDSEGIKRDVFKIAEKTTFYSGVIEHSYYSIFNSAKAYIIFKKIILPEQGQHQAVYYQFKKLVQQGIISEDLLKMYEEVKVKADVLLEILEKEEEKRTKYTYKILPQANKEPAQQSLNNAQFFYNYIRQFIQQGDKENEQ
ncbi:MAG: hypothetical protein AABW80_04455 [Nanoarchaeota archaeon]